MLRKARLSLSAGPTRFAFVLESAIVRAVIPRGSVGVYLLLKNGIPIYVGRSDSCVRERLATHVLASVATHFTWEPCSDVRRAFVLESFWYHRIRDLPEVLNAMHPASPVASEASCPFCEDGDLTALAYALSRKDYQRGSQSIATVDAAHPSVPVDEALRDRRQKRRRT